MINRDSFVPKLPYDKERYIVLATHRPGTISYGMIIYGMIVPGSIVNITLSLITSKQFCKGVLQCHIHQLYVKSQVRILQMPLVTL